MNADLIKPGCLLHGFDRLPHMVLLIPMNATAPSNLDRRMSNSDTAVVIRTQPNLPLLVITALVGATLGRLVLYTSELNVLLMEKSGC